MLELQGYTWSQLVLLRSFHLAALNLHMLLLHPGHFKQEFPQQCVRQAEARDNQDICEQVTASPTGGGRSTLDLVTVPTDKNAQSHSGLLGPSVADSPGSLECFRVRSVTQAP